MEVPKKLRISKYDLFLIYVALVAVSLAYIRYLQLTSWR